jgi:subfamily B ATP-binding cassette protein MsbA
MVRLVVRLLRPYSGWVAIILTATLFETAVSLAALWPLKIILDNVLGGHKAPHWLHYLSKSLPGHSVLRLAALGAAASVTIALIGALASYLDNYYTESVGQSVANDLRLRVYDHLEHLSLA